MPPHPLQGMKDPPWLNPVGEELTVHSGFDHGAVRRQERKEARRITHTVKVDQILVAPMLAHGDRGHEAIIALHSFAAAREPRAPNRFGERRVHELGVHLLDRYFGLDKVVGLRWVGEDDGARRICRACGHFDESGRARGTCQRSPTKPAEERARTCVAGMTLYSPSECFRHQS